MNHLIKEINFNSKAEAVIENFTSKWFNRNILIASKEKSRPKQGFFSHKRLSYIGAMKNEENL